MQALTIVVGFTLAALMLYYFIGQADKSSQFIEALSKGYTSSVIALQGRK